MKSELLLKEKAPLTNSLERLSRKLSCHKQPGSVEKLFGSLRRGRFDVLRFAVETRGDHLFFEIEVSTDRPARLDPLLNRLYGFTNRGMK